MSYLEKDLCSDFSTFMRKNPEAKQLEFSCAIEFKCKQGAKTLHLIKDFQPQQIPMLLKANTQTLYHKISDMSIGMKPFDAFILHKVKAFIGVIWKKDRVPKILYLVPVDTIQSLIESGQVKIKEQEFKQLAQFIFKL
jgi:hypothetical protein